MRILLILAGVALSLAAASQEIYRWVDKDGIVHYSDQPDSPNAVLIDVIEPNAYEAQDSPAASAGRASEPDEEMDASPYTSLSISSPSPDEVFFGADAVVNVSANLQGTLRPDDTLVFFLNGNRTDADGLGTEYAGLARGSYVLRASVLDASGKPVITSPQTTFHVRQPSINSPQSPTAPPKPQPPKPVPKPKPTPRPNSG
jgi:rhodanese-related sulfurtransferase